MDFLTTPIQSRFLQTTPLELIAVLFGLCSVWYMKKEKILAYPFGIINVLIYVYICYTSKLYAYAGINLFYFIMSVYGWYNWSRMEQDEHVIRISSCSRKEWILDTSVLLASSLLLYVMLKSWTDSVLPAWDAVTTAIYGIGMLMLARKKIENWLFWIAGDIISIGLFAYGHLYFSSFQFAVFTVIAFLGYFEWKRKLSGSA